MSDLTALAAQLQDTIEEMQRLRDEVRAANAVLLKIDAITLPNLTAELLELKCSLKQLSTSS